MRRHCETCGNRRRVFESNESGDYCKSCTIKNFRKGALDAGIPLSVIEGKTKLSDHFSDSYIESQCYPKGRPL